MPFFKLGFLTSWLGMTPTEAQQAHKDIKATAAEGGSQASDSQDDSRSIASSTRAESGYEPADEDAAASKVSSI